MSAAAVAHRCPICHVRVGADHQPFSAECLEILAHQRS